MDFRSFAFGAIFVLVMASPGLAQEGSGLDTPEMAQRGEAYRDARTALELNYLCDAYKTVEHWAVERMALDALEQTGWYEAATDYDAYLAYVHEQDAAARERAAGLGCSEDAEPILIAHLEQGMGLIYGDLLIATHFASLPAEDPDHLNLGEDQLVAARQYGSYLEQRFGEGFTSFVQYHGDRAARALQAARESDGAEQGNMFDSLLVEGLDLDAPSGWLSNEELDTLKFDAMLTVDRVLLEVSAETAGLRMLARRHGSRPYYDIVDPQDGTLEMKVWTGPEQPFAQGGFDANAIMALTRAGEVQFIVWSHEGGHDLGDDPTVAIHFNASPRPDQFRSDYDYYRTREWMAGSERITAQRRDSCFGTVCMVFGASDVARMLDASSTDSVELIVAPWANAGQTEPEASGFRGGGIDIGMLRTLSEAWDQAD